MIFGGGDAGSDDDPGLVSTFSSPIGGVGLTQSGCFPVTLTRSLGYSYDRLHRLTGASYPAAGLGQPAQSYAYAYDAAGNRTGQTLNGVATTYQYDAANRLTNVNGVVYSYDNNGNLLSDGVRTYTYDAANRLTQVVSDTTTTQFQYNGDGDRVAQTVNGVITRYALDVLGLPEVIYTSAGEKYLHLPGGIIQQKAGQGIGYLLPDGLGSVRQIVDPTGQIALLQNYDPYGNVLQQVGSASIFGYTGEQTDATGLVFLRARYYNPRIGRFITPDSVVPDPLHSGGWNRYAYVYNNPIRYTDPSGHCIDPVSGTLCVAAIGTTVVLAGALLIAAYTVPGQMEDTQAILETFPLLSPADLWGWFFPPSGTDLQPCSEPTYLPTGGMNIPPYTTLTTPPYVPPYFGPTVPGFYNNPIPLPNVFHSGWEKRQTTYGETIKVKRLNDSEVPNWLEKEKQKQGYAPTDSIYRDREGNLWIGGKKGELNPFP